MNRTEAIMSSSSLTGDDVKNAAGENLGNIKDFMIDTASGRVAYAVLSFGGVLGLGDKLFAVPLSALKLNPEDRCFRLDVDREKLEGAPGFDKSNWPNMADREWGEQIHEYYKTQPYWQ